MRYDEFKTLTMQDFENVMKPVKKLVPKKNYLDLAFDSEYEVKRGEWDEKSGMYKVLESTCISVQFALSSSQKTIYYPLKPSITWQELLDYTLDFLKREDVQIPEVPTSRNRNLYYIVFFGQAELSQISNFRDDETEIDLYSNKSVSCKRKVTKDGQLYIMHMIDLRGYFKTSLAALGVTVGLPKLELNVGGHDHDYWITRMLEFYQKFPREFSEYALRDVEITIKVWNALKLQGIDPHDYRTLAGLAMAEFRLGLGKAEKKYLCKYKTAGEVYARKVTPKKGAPPFPPDQPAEYKTRKRPRLVYDGDWNVRHYAIMSYAGGRNEAYVRGYLTGLNAKFYDFVSLYVAAALIQPLPNIDTAWRKLDVRDIADYEGFANAKFKFPAEERYPCLPIQLSIMNTLLFTLSGETWCTLSELRQALNNGAQLENFSGYGFLPTANETEHALKPYFSELLKKKNSLKLLLKNKDALKSEDAAAYEIEYVMIKSKLVDTVGKFMARGKRFNVRRIGEFMQRMENPEAFRKIASSKAARELYESRGAVAMSWTPEWASLIVGNARACANEIIHDRKVPCLFLSTDGGGFDGTPDFLANPQPLLTKMIKVGGGVHAEGEGDGSFDELWISGNRLYSTWLKGELVKHAQMGNAIHEKDFDAFLRKSIVDGKQAYDTTERKILTGMFLYDFKNVPINSELIQKIAVNFRTDHKRIIVQPDVNIWRECSDTKPFETLEDVFNAYYGIKLGRPRKPHEKKAEGRPRINLTVMQLRQIEASDKTVTHAALAKEYGLSVSTIKRLRQTKTI